MEGKDSDIHDVEELKDLMECCICAKTFNDPRLLPCSHTFCLKCLESTGEKSNKIPGNTMPCPLCTREFTIPLDGFPGLQRNLFVDKLMKMSGVIGPMPVGIQCDTCLEESNPESGKVTPDAAMYCEDCEQNMCEECYRQHSKFRGTKLHKVVDVGEHTKTKAFAEKPVHTFCMLHGRVKLKIFCHDCLKVVCAVCFVESHQSHNGAEVGKAADGFRRQIKEMVIELEEKESEVDGKFAKLDQSKTDLFQSLHSIEEDVKQHYEEIRGTGEKQVKILLLQLENMRQPKMKEVADLKADLERHAVNLVQHRRYCNDIAADGSEVDVCHDMNRLSDKIAELKAQHDTVMELEVRQLKTVFKKSSLDGITGLGETGMIGHFSSAGMETCLTTTSSPIVSDEESV